MLRRFGGSRADEVTFEAVVGACPQEGNPARTLSLSCTVARPPDDVLGAADREPVVAWRVTNRTSECRPGPVSYSEVPDLERALPSYHAPAVSPLAQGGCFYDEGCHHGETKPAA